MADLVSVDVRSGGYAVISMQKEPVNSLDTAMWLKLNSELAALEANPAIQGVIFVSGLKRDVFTAGNDFSELYPPSTTQQKYNTFWQATSDFMVRLYGSRLVTVAAIRGACPAAGCFTALCCDQRIMTKNGHIGMNEVQLGIPVPKFTALLLARTIGHKAAEELLLPGKMLNPQQAQAVGLIDWIVEDKDQLMPAAEQLMQKLVKLPAAARAATKWSLRGDFCEAWAKYASEQEPREFWAFLVREDTVRSLGQAMGRVSKASKSKL